MSVGAWLDGPDREAYKDLLRDADAETFAGLDFDGPITAAERDEANEVIARFDRKRNARARRVRREAA